MTDWADSWSQGRDFDADMRNSGSGAASASLAAAKNRSLDWPALDLSLCSQTTAPPREWTVEGWLPANKATLLAGDGGVGKSLLAQMQATCVAAGLPFLGVQTRQSPAAYLSWEDDQEELWRRQEAICAVLGIRMASLSSLLHLVSYTEEKAPFLVTADAEKGVTPTALGEQIEELVGRHDIGLLILDNASQIAGIDHNAVEQVAPFAHWLNSLAKSMLGSVVLLHHTNKAGDDWLGSVAYSNQFRSRLLLARPSGEVVDPDERVLTNPKANYSRAGASVVFRWFQGAFVRDDDLPPDMVRDLAETAAAAHDNELFLACLDERNRHKRPVSEQPASRTYAPKAFAEMAESKRIGRPRLEAAMDRLFRTGAVERGFIYRDVAEGKDRFGIRRASADLSADLPLTGSADVPLTTRRPPLSLTPSTTYYSGGAPKGAPSPQMELEGRQGSDRGGMILAPGESEDDAGVDL